MEDVTKRGEKLDSLQEKSNDLLRDSKLFEREAKIATRSGLEVMLDRISPYKYASGTIRHPTVTGTPLIIVLHRI